MNVTDGSSQKNVHYVFVPEGPPRRWPRGAHSSDAYHNASTLASRVDNGNTIAWSQVKRLTYELQDLGRHSPDPLAVRRLVHALAVGSFGGRAAGEPDRQRGGGGGGEHGPAALLHAVEGHRSNPA